MLFNFVINRPDAELDYYRNVDIDSAANIFMKYDLEWCLQTYLVLKKRKNVSVVCNNVLLPEAVNIIHSAQLLTARGTSSHFIVCIQADFPHRFWAHYHILQNRNQECANSSVVPLWIQPGLIKRDRNRNGVSKVAYAGQIFKNFAGSVEMWKKLFNAQGIEFATLPSGACSDLHDVDVLIALRSFDTKPHNTKPPSKLINAWHAEIPFIGGYDSAYKQVGHPGEDYLLAKNPKEVLEQVMKLKKDPDLYFKLVQNGNTKAPLYTRDTIAAKWEAILTGPVIARYNAWLDQPSFTKALFFKSKLEFGLLEQYTKAYLKKALSLR